MKRARLNKLPRLLGCLHIRSIVGRSPAIPLLHRRSYQSPPFPQTSTSQTSSVLIRTEHRSVFCVDDIQSENEKDVAEEPAQTDIYIVTDEKESDIENEKIKALLLQSPADVLQFGSDAEDDLSDLPPFTPGELELMWKYSPPCGTAQTSSVKPKIMQIRDAQTEVIEPDLTHFTSDQVASIWAATVKMQQEQSKFSKAGLTCPAIIQSSSLPPFSTTGP